jgi:hypothetical protein
MTTEIELQRHRWTENHSKAARPRGWDLFNWDNTGLLEIQRLDEANKFACDEDAVMRVKLEAENGSEIASLALELDAYFQPLIDEVRAANRKLNAQAPRI